MENQTNINLPPSQTPMPGPTPTGFAGLEHFFDVCLRQKAPFHLPKEAKDFIVQYGPWITAVVLVLGAMAIIPLALLSFGISRVTGPYGMMAGYYHAGVLEQLSILVGLAALVMEAMAIPGLIKRSLSAWHLVYYATLLYAVQELLSYQIIAMIIGLIISMYFLFQIREYYK